jgi:hypothetical protein
VALAVSAPVACDPLVASLPDQAPEAVHEVAFVEDQASVELPPLVTVLGLAVKLTLGTGVGAGAATDTVADCAAVPPRPAQVRVKVEVAVSGPVVCAPFTFSPPVQSPEATQEPALLLVQVRVEALPVLTVLGVAVIVTAGGEGVTVMVAD